MCLNFMKLYSFHSTVTLPRAHSCIAKAVNLSIYCVNCHFLILSNDYLEATFDYLPLSTTAARRNFFSISLLFSKNSFTLYEEIGVKRQIR